MQVLEYQQLNIKGVKSQYEKVIKMLQADDFYSADVKKLKPTYYYRAKLDQTNRLLFKVVDYQGEKFALILEVIHQHNYHKSKFLNGATVDESKIIKQANELEPEKITYINKKQRYFHVLDKIISFDDTQDDIYRLTPPILIIGSAGSGKTALTLEKMKLTHGDILYITHSPYLVQNSRNIYYANGYTNEQQDINFLSYHEFIETILVPPGKEITFKAFSYFANRFKQDKVLRDHHKLFEEIKGVLTGTSGEKPYLDRDEYINLGIKQSIYSPQERTIIYKFFEKYLQFLKQENYYDLNIIAFDYLARCPQSYDFIVIDEIQDFTNIQLLLILKSLRQRQRFMLCGDSNQIVHPNFFSWSKIKTLFYRDEIGDANNTTRILYNNYRNSPEVTHIANLILKIKNARLGSVDKESNYLVTSNSQQPGGVVFLQASSKNAQTLNQQTKKSTQYAVIVIRDEYKQLAKKHFQTPLVFSIHEAKGLEYENIILFDFISSETKAFLEITRGVSQADLQKDLTYSRVKDKSDRSLEVYKFYINALYVAVTRSIKNIYWIESNKKHPLFDLLNIKEFTATLNVKDNASSLEEWQHEARKLEMQGKQEQADAIRAQLVKTKPVPWDILTSDKTQQLYRNVIHTGAAKKSKLLLLEYALLHEQQDIVDQLRDLGFMPAQNTKNCLKMLTQKHFMLYTSKNTATAKNQIEQYGVDFRNPFNQTLLMVAAHVGNVNLAQMLVDAGANIDLLDNINRNALQIALQQAFRDKKYAENKIASFYRLLAPDHVSIQVDGKLIKLGQQHMEYFIFYATLILTYQKKYSGFMDWNSGFSTSSYLNIVEHLPSQILPDYRKMRPYISSILAKNERSRDVSCNRKLFKRVRRGYYVFNDNLLVKLNDQWINIYDLMPALQEKAMATQ
jgi:hypothetical protein